MKIIKFKVACFLIFFAFFLSASARIDEPPKTNNNDVYLVVVNDNYILEYVDEYSLISLTIGVVKDYDLNLYLHMANIKSYHDATRATINLYAKEVDVIIISENDWNIIRTKRTSYMTSKLNVVGTINQNLIARN